MRWPIRNQIFFPFAALLVLSVVLVALVAARNAAHQSRQQKLSHMHNVTSALNDASFPLTQDIAERIAAMIGGEVIAVDPSGRISASTLRLESLPAKLVELKGVTDEVTHSVSIGNREYFVTIIPRLRVPQSGPIFVLLEQDGLQALRRNAVRPILIVATPTVIVALVLALLISHGFAVRVERLRTLFGKLSAGQYSTIETGRRFDEFHDLLRSANDLSNRLKHLQEELKRNERLELLGQLSGALAHQLRNSIAGARLAVQLHEQECTLKEDEMLMTAKSQLRLTEEQVRAVLTLRDDALHNAEPEEINLHVLLDEVCSLLRPYTTHWKTDLRVISPPNEFNVKLNSMSAIKGALLNLILNAVEAAGTQGNVQIHLSIRRASALVEIKDDGPGFNQDFEILSDAFQTTKSEGIGLGLTIAQHAIAQENGELSIARESGWTNVQIHLPDAVLREKGTVN